MSELPGIFNLKIPEPLSIHHIPNNGEPDERNPWIRTHTGRRFYPFHPREEDIVVEDIAHALSHLCRFLGHTSRFYSVAEHSVWVSRHCDPVDALHGLLHDAQEAYCGDLASPIKRRSELHNYRVLECGIERAVAEKFGLLYDMPRSVKQADEAALAYELDTLFDVHPLAPQPFEPLRAKALFLERFEELTHGR